MIIKETKYSYNDVMIIPSEVSNICHRGDINPFNDDEMLPIFTAPMDTVVNESNFELFEKNKITPILPRNIDLDIRLKFAFNNKWAAFSLKEFEENFIGLEWDGKSNYKALIDVANGHMK